MKKVKQTEIVKTSNNWFRRAREAFVGVDACPDKTSSDYRKSEGKEHIASMLASLAADKDNIMFVCIGTDRSTGDALGPLVGTFLQEAGFANVMGTLDEPVHAANLHAKLATIPPGSFVVAIDACLSDLNKIGEVSLRKGSLRPGAGVKKDLPPVGNCGFTGVVNVGGYMEYLVLQNTRLSFVMGMAKYIVDIIDLAFPVVEEKEEAM